MAFLSTFSVSLFSTSIKPKHSFSQTDQINPEEKIHNSNLDVKLITLQRTVFNFYADDGIC